MPLVIGGMVHTHNRENGSNFSGRNPKQESTLSLKNSSQSSCHVHCGEVIINRAMHLMRCLTFFVSYYDFILLAEHLPGKDNIVADALSE